MSGLVSGRANVKLRHGGKPYSASAVTLASIRNWCVSCGSPLATIIVIKAILELGMAAFFQDLWVIVLIIFFGAVLGGVIFALPALVRLAAYAFLSRQ